MSFRPLLPCWLLALSILGCAAPKALAQDKPVKQKPQVILYKDMVSAQWDTVKCVKNAIKINPLLFFRGEIPIHYERALTPRLSVELGLGFTWRDYLNLNFGGGDADDYGGGTDIIARPTYHVGLRWYPPSGLRTPRLVQSARVRARGVRQEHQGGRARW
ncbi:MAG: hypothetical protein IPI07_02635 [Flavobacteriales bacterium]|nr:hypothetical protein [Flavobacteriales bacterium]